MKKLFTSESVSEGHPDKIADQISDAILDSYLAFDHQSHVGCETFVTTGQVIIAGETKSKALVPVSDIARRMIKKIGYVKSEFGFAYDSVGIMNAMHRQSSDIAQGVDTDDQGAGDQGMMFGYATNETPAFIPFPLYLSHLIVKALSEIRKEGKIMTYLRPDAKSQVTVETDKENRVLKIDTVVVSTQHDDFLKGNKDVVNAEKTELKIITSDIVHHVFPRVVEMIPEGKSKEIAKQLLKSDYRLFVNPTGRFVIGGPAGDCGLTGRKIIVDTYGGYAPHGGGAFSGKDPSKVDRSAAYAARYFAKNLVAAGIADEVTIQLAYAIGVAKPVSISLKTVGKHVELSDEEIAEAINELYDLSPKGITKLLCLESPIYTETAAYGHFGRDPQRVSKEFTDSSGNRKTVEVNLFPWENTDAAEIFMNHFSGYYI